MQHGVTMLRQNRLWVKLHTLNAEFAVAKPHDHIEFTSVVYSPGCYLQAIRQRRRINRKRVIPRCRKGRWQPLENTRAIVVNIACFAMHDLGRPDNVATIGSANALHA